MRNSIRYPHLLSAPVFADLPEDFRVNVIDQCSVQMHETSTAVLEQGAPVGGVYFVASGSVEVTADSGQGQTALIHLSRQGEIFGEVEALAERNAVATCTVAPGTELLFCPKPVLFECAHNPVFVRNLMRLAHDRLVRDTASKFVDQFYPVEQRLCAYLHRLSAERRVITKTQADLAGLLGCARQTLNRELGRLRDSGIIEMQKGRIRVLDREALVRLGPVRDGFTNGEARLN